MGGKTTGCASLVGYQKKAKIMSEDFDPEEAEAQGINSFALGGEASALENHTLASKNAHWRVKGDDFSLLIGDVNLTTKLNAHERIILRGICERLFDQAKAQEDRL